MYCSIDLTYLVVARMGEENMNNFRQPNNIELSDGKSYPLSLSLLQVVSNRDFKTLFVFSFQTA